MKNRHVYKLLAGFLLLLLVYPSLGQIDARLVRQMDISQDKVVFSYGGDLWTVAKSGGIASQVTDSPGEESHPRFSPDGQWIAFSAEYNGNTDVYLMSAGGGVPKRMTWQSLPDIVVDWHPDGKRILFKSRRELGQRSGNQFYLVHIDGGLPEKLSVPYGEWASYSADGKSLAYVMRLAENYPFKRYMGGLNTDIILWDLGMRTSHRIRITPGNDTKPYWSGDNIYFLSDNDESQRRNLWKYSVSKKSFTKLTSFTDFDIMYMTGGAEQLVFEAGGTLYTLPMAGGEPAKINISVVNDLATELPRTISVGRDITNMSAAPGGKRLALEARGEVFDVPVSDGFVRNITRSSGSFDRNPAWSPDGKSIAYWSDRSGEWEIWLENVNGNGSDRRLTNRTGGYGYDLYWSPDSRKITYVDEKNDIWILDVLSSTEKKADNLIWNLAHPGRQGFPIMWSPDSKWITYSKGQNNANGAIFLYEISTGRIHQVTSGYFNDNWPAFSADGKYLFYLSDRNMDAVYSALDNTWVYPNSTHLVSIGLQKSTPSLMAPKNDVQGKKEQANENGDKTPTILIDMDRMESRLVILEKVEPGNLGAIYPFENKVVFLRYPNSGSEAGVATLSFYDLEKREVKTIIGGVRNVKPTADNKSLAVRTGAGIGVLAVNADQKLEKPVKTDGMTMELIPREEWRQLFNDAWRRHRDFFYDPGMHGLDWAEVKNRYAPLIEQARTKWDVNFIISELVAELSAGHTYTSGGDMESVLYNSSGYLGVDWELINGKYRIKRIVTPAPWDYEVRSPLQEPGIDVKAGEYILSVNGILLDPKLPPYAYFEGLGEKTVLLKVSSSGSENDAREVTIKTLSPEQEVFLRHLEWIEENRKMVDKLSGGKLGYIYMSNTSDRGQKELVQHFYGQLDKQGFIIDERYNGGGQLADRFLELLQRPVTYNLHWRHGKDHTNPIKTNTGPMGMLINGSAGSGGDGLPWAFQELKAGPIVGERTLGILVGPATGHRLIDGTTITVPGARLYDNDGHWFWEGYGVSPDFEVWDDPAFFAAGRDPQMEKVVEEVLKLLKDESWKMTPAPPYEKR